MVMNMFREIDFLSSTAIFSVNYSSPVNFIMVNVSTLGLIIGKKQTKRNSYFVEQSLFLD